MNPFDIEYEAVEAPAAAEAGGEAAPAAEVAVEGTPSPEAAPPAPTADPFADYGLAADDVRDLGEMLPFLRQAMQAQPEATPQTPTTQAEGAPEWDPFDPASVQAYNEWNNTQLLGQIQQLISPITSQAQAQAERENVEKLKDVAHDTETRLGEFLGKPEAQQISRDFMLNVARDEVNALGERYGQVSDQMAQRALDRAHAHTKQWESAIADAAVEQYKNQLATLSGARQEPGKGAAGAETPGEYATEQDALAAWIARHTDGA